ncbi:MAG: hypothetical protein QXL51_03735 [Candidatus Aenigmatarchaeota archaeon]
MSVGKEKIIDITMSIVLIVISFIGAFAGAFIGRNIGIEKSIITTTSIEMKTLTTTITETILKTEEKGASTGEEEYIFITEFEGGGSLTTDYFYVPSDEWRIKWEFESPSEYGYLCASINMRGGLLVDTFASPNGTKANGIHYVHHIGRGEFYLNVIVTFVKHWKIVIEAKKEKGIEAMRTEKITETITEKEISTIAIIPTTITTITKTVWTQPYFTWTQVVVMEGWQGESKTSSVFRTTRPFRVVWFYNGYAGAELDIIVYNSMDNKEMWCLTLTKEGHNEDIWNIENHAVLDLYIKVETKNIKDWMIIVEVIE